MAARGRADPWLLLITLVSGICAAGAANTMNCLYDRDIDFLMERTRHRPLPSGRIQPHHALLFAITLTLTSFTLLAIFANLLSAGLAVIGIVVYVLIYTHWLKRHHSQNIVIGGAAGAIPPLVGWAAVTGDLSWAAWCLFAIVFLWTPPHFWALAMMLQDDYAKVNVAKMIAAHHLDVWIYRGKDWFVHERHGPHVDREEWTVKFPPTVVSSFDGLFDNIVKIVGVSDDLEAVVKCETDVQKAFSPHVHCKAGASTGGGEQVSAELRAIAHLPNSCFHLYPRQMGLIAAISSKQNRPDLSV